MDQRRSFLEILIAWRGMMLRLVLVMAIVSVIVSLLLPRWYGASAVITPPQEGDGGLGLASIMDQIGGAVGVGRARSLLKRTPEVDLMIGVLKSRRIRGEVVDRFDLVDRYDVKTREHAINKLGERLRVSTTPEGLIEVRVEARDAEVAANLANAFVELLDQYNRESSVQDARRTREFIRACRDESRERLEEAAGNLRRFQEQHGAIEIGEQTRVTVEAMAELEAERTRLAIEKAVMESYSRSGQPKVREIETTMDEIDKHLRQLRGSAGEDSADVAPETPPSDVLIPLSEFPRIGLAFADLKREVLVQEKVYGFLTNQLEEARIREARDLETVRVLDAAVPPIRRSRPRRSLIVIATTGLALLLSVGIAVSAEAFRESAASGAAWTETREARVLLRITEWLRDWGAPADRPPK